MSVVIKTYLNTSIMKKLIVGMTGLFLCLFITGHLVGNTLMIFSSKAFNYYGHTLVSNPFIYVIEFGLIAIFLTHILMALTVTFQNWASRPISYKNRDQKFALSGIASATMPYTGAIILIFVVVHVLNLKFGAHYTASYDGDKIRDLHRLTLEFFSNPLNVIGYIVTMVILTFHVLHGFWSAFHTLGLNKLKFDKFFRFASYLFGLLMIVSYVTFPVWCYLQGVK